MGETIDSAETRTLTREYANDECAGTLGEIVDVNSNNGGDIGGDVVFLHDDGGRSGSPGFDADSGPGRGPVPPGHESE